MVSKKYDYLERCQGLSQPHVDLAGKYLLHLMLGWQLAIMQATSHVRVEWGGGVINKASAKD